MKTSRCCGWAKKCSTVAWSWRERSEHFAKILIVVFGTSHTQGEDSKCHERRSKEYSRFAHGLGTMMNGVENAALRSFVSTNSCAM